MGRTLLRAKAPNKKVTFYQDGYLGINKSDN